MVSRLKYYLLILPLAFAFYPTFVWMWERWTARDSYYAHGALIPLVTLYWIFKKKRVLAENSIGSPSFTALWIFIVGAMLQLFSVFFRIYFISSLAFILVLLGAVGVLFGNKILKMTAYPLAFLFLMVPLPLLAVSQLTIQMKFFVSQAAAVLISATGIQAVREGSYIHTPHAVMLVGDPCSGLRSFLAFLCLGFVFAYESPIPIWKKLVIIAAGLPLAILSNIARVYALGMLSEIYGNHAVEGFIHDASGFVVFVMALAALMALRKFLEGRRTSHE